jgi:hypothetical protein
MSPAQMRRLADRVEDAIEQRLREGSPRSGARHVRLTDSVQVGENEFEDPREGRWLIVGAVFALILVAVIVVGRLVSDYFEGLFV